MVRAVTASSLSRVKRLLNIPSVRKIYYSVGKNGYAIEIDIGPRKVEAIRSAVMVDVKSIHVGIISKILVSIGDVVEEDQALAIIETLGIQHEIFAPSNGEVAEICTLINDCVEYGSKILVLKTTK